MPTLDEFRNNTGAFAPEDSGMTDTQEGVTEEQDAAVQDEPEIDGEEDTTLEAPSVPSETFDDSDEPKLTEKEKTAFQKLMEREKRKLEEEKERIRLEALEKAKKEANPYKEVVDLLGGDIEAIKATVERNKMLAEANNLANQYGWDEEQTQYYIQQKQAEQRQKSLERELQELRISNQVNDLRDNPNFPGIRDMRKEITELVSKSNGTLNVEQAYWALGGAKRADQMRLEIQQREAVRRQEARKTAQNDQGSTPTGEKPIPEDVRQQARAMGITSDREIRELMEFNAANLSDYRSKRKAK